MAGGTPNHAPLPRDAWPLPVAPFPAVKKPKHLLIVFEGRQK